MIKKLNPLQKFVRVSIREFINDINASKPKKKLEKNKKITKAEKRSRYISSSVRVDVLKRDRFSCVFCGTTAKETQLQIDHIIPFSKGGSNNISNLQTLCVECNRGKSDRFF